MTKNSQLGLKQFVAGCPLEKFFAFLGKRWALQIICSLGENGELAFGQLSRTLPGRISAKVMTARLRDLEKRNLVVRRMPEVRGNVVFYRLTPTGRDLHRLLQLVEKRLVRFDLAPASRP